MSAIEKAIKIVGGQSALAAKLGSKVSQQQVWNWLNNGRAPSKYIRQISIICNKKISVDDLLKDHEI